jgi:hypothetical protein
MAKSKWFKLVRTTPAEFEYKGRVIPTTLEAGSLIEIGRHAAQAALDRMKSIHAYMAPEVNGGLTKRLFLAQIVPASQVTGVEFEIV